MSDDIKGFVKSQWGSVQGPRTQACLFVETLREVCDASGAVLIFDEVMTGFRVALGGVQAMYGVMPDLTTLGKIIGGGMPVGAFGGKREIMEKISPLGPVYQAGTLSGNPVAMTAGLKTLELISAPGFFDELTHKTAHLVNGLREKAETEGVPVAVLDQVLESHHLGADEAPGDIRVDDVGGFNGGAPTAQGPRTAFIGAVG